MEHRMRRVWLGLAIGMGMGTATVAVAQESSALRHEMASGFAAARQETAALRQEMTNGFAQVRQEIADAKVHIIKWSFLFWTSQFFTTAGFLLLLLRSR